MRLRILLLVFSGFLVALPLSAADVPIHDIQGAGAESLRAGQTVSIDGCRHRPEGKRVLPPGHPTPRPTRPRHLRRGLRLHVVGANRLGGGRQPRARDGHRPRVPPVVRPVEPAADRDRRQPAGRLSLHGKRPPVARPPDAGRPLPALPADRLERFEGMRVRVDTLLVVAPTGGTVDEPTATSRTNGVFFGVLAGTPRPSARRGSTRGSRFLPAARAAFPASTETRSGCASTPTPCPALPRSTWRPVRRFPASSGRSTTPTGPTRSFPRAVPSVAGSPAARAVPVPSAGDLTVGSLNLERFFDARASGAGPTLSPEAYEARLKKASLAIRTLLRPLTSSPSSRSKTSQPSARSPRESPPTPLPPARPTRPTRPSSSKGTTPAASTSAFSSPRASPSCPSSRRGSRRPIPIRRPGARSC